MTSDRTPARLNYVSTNRILMLSANMSLGSTPLLFILRAMNQ